MRLKLNLLFLSLMLAAVSIPVGCATARAGGGGEAVQTETFLLEGLRPPGVPVGCMIVRNEEEWKNFWSQHSQKPAPDIDFEKNDLVMIFLGQKPNTGYSVKITHVREYPDKVVAEALETEPQPGALYAQVIVYPYDAVLIPKTDKNIECDLKKENVEP